MIYLYSRKHGLWKILLHLNWVSRNMKYTDMTETHKPYFLSKIKTYTVLKIIFLDIYSTNAILKAFFIQNMILPIVFF